MKPRNTLLLALVVAALAAFVWFYEIEGGAQRTKQEEAAKHLFPGVTAEQIQSIELRTSDGSTARLEREGDAGWKLVAPLQAPADRFAADGLASTLAELSPEASFDTPEPLENYGLTGEPRVRFRAGDKDYALRIGNATPVGGNVYATDGAGERVYTLASWRRNALDKTVKQLRDARVLDFDRAQIKGITLASGDGRVVLARVEDGWRIAEPVEARSDTDAVEGLLSDLQYLRADEFVDAPADDAELGLAAPWLRVELVPESGEPLRLAVGAVRGERRVVRGSAERVFEIASTRLESLPRTLAAFRWKQLASFAPTDAARFELRFEEPGAEPVTIVGARGEGDAFSTAPEPMAPGKASGLLSALSSLRAEDVAADAMGDAERAALGLAPPRTTLRVLGKPNSGHAEGPVLADVRLGIPQPDGRIPAQRAGDATVYWLAASAREQLPVGLGAWRESFVTKETPPAAPAAEPEPQQTSSPEPSDPPPPAPGS
jgi:Domain of unknown function (DUF4340)